MLYEIFHTTQFIFQLIYLSASSLQTFFMTEFDAIIAEAVGTDIQIFGPGVTVLECLFSTGLMGVLLMIIFNFLKNFLPGSD